MDIEFPRLDPIEVAPETFVLPHLFPMGPDEWIPVNSMLIRGKEPVIVDTNAPIFRERWLEQVFSLVDPADVRWIFLSHDDTDHTGGLLDALELCPNATLVTNMFSVERMALESKVMEPTRMRWIQEGESFDAGDRTLHLFKPPVFDGPTTRGLYDPTTATMWAVDTFACPTTGTMDINELPHEMVAEAMPEMNSMVSPWHQWLDPTVYRDHVDSVEDFGVLTVATAHSPVLTGDAIHRAFDLVRDLAGRPILPGPGQELLDDILSQAAAEPVPATVG